MALCAYLKRLERFRSGNLAAHLEGLEQQEELIPKRKNGSKKESDSGLKSIKIETLKI